MLALLFFMNSTVFLPKLKLSRIRPNSLESGQIKEFRMVCSKVSLSRLVSVKVYPSGREGLGDITWTLCLSDKATARSWARLAETTGSGGKTQDTSKIMTSSSIRSYYQCSLPSEAGDTGSATFFHMPMYCSAILSIV